ncbi:MAG: nicotinate-nucleotide adenylyltransferase [Myxococcota bacterium]
MTESNRERRYGLFGGTFNPIHIGHLRAAEEVREALALEHISFIPSRTPPHKKQDHNDPIAPVATRLHWVERAIAPHEHFSIDRIEVNREGPSYLVDTLRTIRERDAAEALPVFILGEDAFSEMGDWREAEELFAMSDYAVMTRPPGQLNRLEAGFPKAHQSAFAFEDDGQKAWHTKTGSCIELVPITAIDISSSLVREACRRQRSLRYLVPESIRSELEMSHEYARPQTEDQTHG